MEKEKIQFENESDSFLEKESAKLIIGMFDELCKVKQALDQSNVEIMKRRRSLTSIDIHNLSKEKRNWIDEDLRAIDRETKKISEICGQIEFLKIRLRGK